MKKLISICIPTFNRYKYINDFFYSLENEKNEIRNKIEICISDNQSTDNTEELVNTWINRNLVAIKFSKNNVNIGPEKNYIKAAELATGKYIWFFGSDDALNYDGLKKVIILLEEIIPDLLLTERLDVDITLKNPRQNYFTNKNINSFTIDTSNKLMLSWYFNQVNRITGIFSYLSNIIVLRSRFEKRNLKEGLLNSGYYHVPPLLSILLQGCRFSYLKEPVVLHRVGLDTFSKNYAQRKLLDINGFLKVKNSCFEPSDYLGDDFIRIISRTHSLIDLIKIQMMIKKSEKKKLLPKLIQCGYQEKDIKMAMRISKNKLYFLFFYILKKIR